MPIALAFINRIKGIRFQKYCATSRSKKNVDTYVGTNGWKHQDSNTSGAINILPGSNCGLLTLTVHPIDESIELLVMLGREKITYIDT